MQVDGALSESLIRNSLDGVVAFDHRYRVTVWNPAMERMWGVDRADAIGQPVFDLFPSLAEMGQADCFSRALAGATVVTRNLPYNVAKSGRCGLFDGHYSPLSSASGDIPGGLGIIRDVSQHAADEKEREWLEERLLRLQRSEVVEQLSASIAHDFNNSLTAILGSVDNLVLILERELDQKPHESLRHEINRVQIAGQHALGLAQHLRTPGRTETTGPEGLDPGALIHRLGGILRSVIREDIAVEVRVAPALRAVTIDAGQMEQVVLNLVLNAQDAMPEGGKLTIVCSNVTEDRLAGQGHFVELVVADTGVGMEPDTRDRIFGLFYTTKRKEEGTGLGLASVHRIVTRAGGRITVESEPGRGSTFRTWLPVVDVGMRVGMPPPLDPTAGRDNVILVCDDQAPIREVTCELLRNAGYTVLEAGSGEEALRSAATFQGKTDLLITDLSMPGMSGTELAAEMARLHPEARLLFISGGAEEFEQSLSPGRKRDFLRKPFTSEVILQRVRSLLD